MISFTLPKMPTIFTVIVVTLLSACGGGGGSAGGEGGFTASNTNTKPQISSDSSSSSAKSQSSTSSSSVSISVTSSSRTSTTIIDTQAPTPSASLTSEIVLSDRVILNWSPAVDNVGTAFYKIYRDNAQIDTVYASDNTYYDFDVAASKTYTYSISAGDASGNWSALTNLMVNTPAITITSSASSAANSSVASSQVSSAASSSAQSSATQDIATPSQPTEVTKVNAFSTQVDISWSAATDNIGVTAYKVYRDGALLSTVSNSVQNYSDKTVSPNVSYWYGVSAGDAAGNWSAQKLVNITTPTPLVTGTINLKWLPPSQRENGVTLTPAEIGGYEIRYRSITENTYKYASIASTQTQASLSNLVGDYVFEIAVFDTNGLYSNFVSITPQ